MNMENNMDSTHLYVGHEPQLLVDSYLIECTQGLTRRWYKPTRHGDSPLICQDQPWEQTPYFTYSNYNVLRDPQDTLIKCWYEDLGEIDGKAHPWRTRLLYAESQDGINFRKPELDICRVNGKLTNIVMGYTGEVSKPSELNPWANVGVHSSGIIIDPMKTNSDERFRTFFSRAFLDSEGSPQNTTECAHSADGLHWRPYSTVPRAGSSGSFLEDVSCLHYDKSAGIFVMNTRHGKMSKVALPPETTRVSNWFAPYYPHRPDLMNKRRIWQTRSHDFLNWTELVPVSVPDDDIDNLDEAYYGMQQFQVGRLHFATLGILRYVDNEMEVRLLYSRDGVHFHPTDRAKPFLAPQGQGHWDAHMVSLSSPPIEMGDEWWFYHGGTCAHHDWWLGPPEGIDEPEVHNPAKHVKFGLGLATLRKEGVASLDGCKQRDGYFVTRPLMSPGERLVINGRCRPGGSIRATILDMHNQPIDGCSLEESDAFTSDSVRHAMRWQGNLKAGGGGKWRKLHFLIRNAEIFSFQLGGAEDVH
jgi:hypothetical protein